MNNCTLNINFEALLSTKADFMIAQRERNMILCSDKMNKRVYINDSFDPSRVLCITTSPGEEFKQTAVNTRCIKTFEIAAAAENGLFAELRGKTSQFFSSNPVFTGVQDVNAGIKLIGQFVP